MFAPRCISRGTHEGGDRTFSMFPPYRPHAMLISVAPREGFSRPFPSPPIMSGVGSASVGVMPECIPDHVLLCRESTPRPNRTKRSRVPKGTIRATHTLERKSQRSCASSWGMWTSLRLKTARTGWVIIELLVRRSWFHYVSALLRAVELNVGDYSWTLVNILLVGSIFRSYSGKATGRGYVSKGQHTLSHMSGLTPTPLPPLGDSR